MIYVTLCALVIELGPPRRILVKFYMGDYFLKSVHHIQILFILVKYTLHEDVNRFMILFCH